MVFELFWLILWKEIELVYVSERRITAGYMKSVCMSTNFSFIM